MSESLQGRRTTSNDNTWVANSYYILYDKENRFVLSRYLNLMTRDLMKQFVRSLLFPPMSYKWFLDVSSHLEMWSRA